MGETTRQQPPGNPPSLNVDWEPGTSFTAGAAFAFTWSNTDVNTDGWDTVTPILFYEDSKKTGSNKIKEWADIAVSTHIYLLTLPQIDDQQKRTAYMELWCSKKDKPKATKALCGKSPQFSLQPHNNNKPAPSPSSSSFSSFSSSITKVSTTAPTTAVPSTTTLKTTTTAVDKYSTTLTTTTTIAHPTGPIIPSIDATTSIVNANTSNIVTATTYSVSATITNLQKHTTSLTSIVATQMPSSPSQPLPPQDKGEAKNSMKTKAPPAATPTADCKENVPNPSCLPIIPSFIAPSSSSSTTSSLSNPANATSDKSESYAGSRMDGGVISVIVIVCAMVLTLGLYSLHIRRQRIRGTCDDEDGRQRLRGGGGECGGDGDDPETRSVRSSMSSVRNYGRTRPDRITPPWSMTFVPANNNESGEPQVPPVHISHPVLVEDPARKQRWQRQQQVQSPRQRAAALHLQTHSHTEDGDGGSNPMSPVSTQSSSRYRGAASRSPRYPVTGPGGGVVTTAQAAHAMHSRTPLPPMSSEPSSPTTTDRPETPPIRAWSPFSGRRRLTNASARTTSSRALSIFSELSDLTSGSSSWTDKDNDDDCGDPLRQGFETRPVEFPKPAALRRTHISPPIRSMMSVSNEEGNILARQDILIRMEEDEQDHSDDDEEDYDYANDHGSRCYEQQQPENKCKNMNRCSNRSRYRDSEDSYFSRQNSHNYHLPNQLHSSTSTLSRQGLHHHSYHQHQRSLYNPRRSSMVQAGYCPSIVPPIPRIPQGYISSEESSLSRGSSVLSLSLSSSRPIGYDPEWVDTVGEGDEYHDDDDGSDYTTREANWRKRSSSGSKMSRGMGRKGSEVSRPMSRSVMKAVRHERRWSRVSPALSVTQASEWARSRELERVASNSGGGVDGSSVERVGGGYHDERQQQRHFGMEYY